MGENIMNQLFCTGTVKQVVVHESKVNGEWKARVYCNFHPDKEALEMMPGLPEEIEAFCWKKKTVERLARAENKHILVRGNLRGQNSQITLTIDDFQKMKK
jgi:hypothetical protein